MMGTVVDQRTLERVRAAGPWPGGIAPSEARQVAMELVKLAELLPGRLGMDDERYWEAGVQEICANLPPALTPKRVGAILRGLGLTLVRRKQGFVALWNRAQLLALGEYFDALELPAGERSLAAPLPAGRGNGSGARG